VELEIGGKTSLLRPNADDDRSGIVREIIAPVCVGGFEDSSRGIAAAAQ
jgi:hypothetical protein